jgi:hypothetical protein
MVEVEGVTLLQRGGKTSLSVVRDRARMLPRTSALWVSARQARANEPNVLSGCLAATGQRRRAPKCSCGESQLNVFATSEPSILPLVT